VAGTGDYPWQTSAASEKGGIMWAGAQGGGGDKSGLWVSTNGGASFREVNATTSGLPNDAVWSSVAVSADGQTVVATAADGSVWTSIDGGLNFTNTSAPPGNHAWTSVSSSGNSSFLLAAEQGGSCWISFNGGQTWVEQNQVADAPSPGDWVATAVAADGSSGWAADAGGNLWVYDVATDTWTKASAAGRHDWSSLAVSADGQTIFAGTASGTVYYSLDGGLTWQQDTSAGTQPITGIALAADGQSAVVSTAGAGIYTWVDGNSGGKTYAPTSAPVGNLVPVPGTTAYNWSSIAGDANNTNLVATVDGGKVRVWWVGGWVNGWVGRCASMRMCMW